MHPSIRILCCVTFIVLVSMANWIQLAWFAVILVISSVIFTRQSTRSSAAMIWRLKWLFVSIIIVSGWFTPGIPLVAGYETLSPSLEGINFGLLRVLILVEIVIAVNILMMTTSTPDLVSALQWLLTPLSIFGINSNKIAARIVTTIDEIKSPTIDLKKLIQETRKETPLNRMTHVITRAYIMSINGMKHDNDVEILLQQQKAPSIFQWLWLPLIILFYYIPVIIY